MLNVACHPGSQWCCLPHFNRCKAWASSLIFKLLLKIFADTFQIGTEMPVSGIGALIFLSGHLCGLLSGYIYCRVALVRPVLQANDIPYPKVTMARHVIDEKSL